MACDAALRIGLVLMASGFSRRYGSNKLLIQIDGISMIERAFNAIPEDAVKEIVVVTQYSEIKMIALKKGFSVITNDFAYEGISSSIKLGTEALVNMDGIIFCVADQPYIKKETVKKLIDTFKEHPGEIIVPVSGGRRGNPCVFPKTVYDELLKLKGENGGKSVVSRHEDMVICVEVGSQELLDVDEP